MNEAELKALVYSVASKGFTGIRFLSHQDTQVPAPLGCTWRSSKRLHWETSLYTSWFLSEGGEMPALEEGAEAVTWSPLEVSQLVQQEGLRAFREEVERVAMETNWDDVVINQRVTVPAANFPWFLPHHYADEMNWLRSVAEFSVSGVGWIVMERDVLRIS